MTQTNARVALVTGAGGGIGLGIAEVLADAGYAVAVADVDPQVASTAADGLASPAGTVGIGGDLSSAAGAQAAVDATLERFGRLDVLVNNAGGGVIRPFLEHDQASIDETIARNLLTAIHCCRAAIPALRASAAPRIVMVGAESVRNGLSMHAMYNAAKGGVHALCSGLAREFAADGITVNCVAPSIIETPPVTAAFADRSALPPPYLAMLDEAVDLIPMGRPGSIAEVAVTVAFLASPEASFITGQVISVNGGSSMQ